LDKIFTNRHYVKFNPAIIRVGNAVSPLKTVGNVRKTGYKKQDILFKTG